MKIIVLFFFLTFGLFYNNAQEILSPPKVDERIELLSIVFRLAENKEYNSKKFPEYVAKIEKHFSAYKKHKLIDFVKNTLKNEGIGYDAVMSMAIAISSEKPFYSLDDFKSLDDRWSEKNAKKFLKLLNRFYSDSKADIFFGQNQQLYRVAETNFLPNYEFLDKNWYSQFYGVAPTNELKLVVGLGNGGSNYGPKVTLDQKELDYAIIGTWTIDSLGMPIFPKETYFPFILHEFNHSFVNHLVELNKQKLKSSGEKLYSVVQDKMESQAYGNWETMISESLVRAAVIKYMKDHNFNEKDIQNEILIQINRHFLWIEGLLDKLDEYDKNRTQYPDFESFMPIVVDFFNDTAITITQLKSDIESRKPKVLRLLPFENGSQSVNANTKKIEIVFDQPLTGDGYSINYGSKGEETFPEMGDITYSENNTFVFIEVDLEPNREYQFVLTGLGFKSQEGYGIVDYEISFKTE